MESTVVAVKELPATLQNALRKMGYRRPDIRLYLAAKIDMTNMTGEGFKALGAVVNMVTGEFKTFEGSWGGPNPYETKPMDVKTRDYDIPDNGAVIKGEFGGTGGKTYLDVYVNPKSVMPMLPGGSELNDREEQILSAHQYMSKYKKELLQRMRAKPEEFTSLIQKGLITRNSAGATALTTKGKNEVDRIKRGRTMGGGFSESIVDRIRNLAIRVGVRNPPKKAKGVVESKNLQGILDIRGELFEQDEPEKKAPKPLSRMTSGGEKLLMKKVKYKVSPSNKSEKSDVEGVALNRWVAIREPSTEDVGGDSKTPLQGGWFVDHIPTGFAIAQELPNKKAAMLIAKSFIDMVPENVQRMNNPTKMLKMIDKTHARAFYLYAKDVRLKRTSQEFGAWREENGFPVKKVANEEAGDGTEVADEIMRQLGGKNRIGIMIGVSGLVVVDNPPGVQISFKARARDMINRIRITLAPSDTYTVEFGKVRAGAYKKIDEVNDVYNDMLKRIIEKRTGLALSL